MNVLLITIDTLRFDSVGYSREYEATNTPILDEISRDGLVYKNAFSSGTSTPFSFPGILASAYSHQFRGGLGITMAPASLPEYLKEKRYMTCGLNGGNLYVSSVYGYGSRFQFFSRDVDLHRGRKNIDGKAMNSMKSLMKQLGARRLLKVKNELSSSLKYVLNCGPLIEPAESQIEKFRSFLCANSAKKFFCLINLMEFHGPYLSILNGNWFERLRMLKISSRRGELSNPKYLRWIRQYHLSALEIVDKAIGNIFNMLDSMRLLGDTLVIITSDHGDEYLEHGDYDHKPKPYDELIRVPLIMFNKSLFSGCEERENNDLVSLVDLAPSIAKFLFNENPKHFMGETTLLGGNVIRDYVLSEGFQRLNDPHRRHDPKREGVRNWAVRTKKWKFLSMGDEKFMFDLASDPQEKHKLASDPVEGEVKDFVADTNRRELSSSVNIRMSQRH